MEAAEMKRRVVLSLLVIALFLPSGCSSSHYVIKTKSGTEYVSTEKPEFNKETKSYTFYDLSNKQWTINREEVQSIEETEK